MLNKWRLLPHVFSRLFARFFPHLLHPATAPWRDQPPILHPIAA
jgi:hypothetical protein